MKRIILKNENDRKWVTGRRKSVASEINNSSVCGSSENATIFNQATTGINWEGFQAALPRDRVPTCANANPSINANRWRADGGFTVWAESIKIP